MLRLSLLLLLSAITTSLVTATDRRLLRNGHDDDHKKHVKSYLRCSEDEFSCGPDGRIHLCHYNGQDFTTLCVRSRSSIVEHLHPVDYCGPCMDGGNAAMGDDKKPFETTKELQKAVDWYLTTDRTAGKAAHKALAAEYGYPMGQWDVSRITNFRGLFARKVQFDEDLSGWNMSSATDLSFMFWHAHAFAGNGVSAWDVSKVQSMERTFFGAEQFTSDLSNWQTHSLTNLMGTFWRATAFNSNVGNWNTTGVTTMSRCFSDAIAFNQDLSKWNTQQVTDMSYMFQNALRLEQPGFSQWNVQHVHNFERMFAKVPYYQIPSVHREILRTWHMPRGAIVNNMFSAPVEKSLRAQQLEANMAVEVQTLMRLAGQKPNITKTSDGDEEEEDVAISREILCHGGVCM